MQNAALADLGLGEQWIYEAIDVASEDFDAKVASMAAGGFAGANVTVPHKAAALAIADVPDPEAREIGAANTLSFKGGAVLAHNTDAAGFLAALPEPPTGKRVLVLGAGGAARAIVWALQRADAVVDVWNRTTSRAESLVEGLGGTVAESPRQDAYELIVHSSSLGLHGDDQFSGLPLEPGGFNAGQVVVDMVYGAGPTPFLMAAEAAGATTVDGLEILVRQGALSLEIWTGRRPSLEVMRAAARG